MRHGDEGNYDDRFSCSAGSIAMARRIADAVAMMVRGLSVDDIGRDKKDALLHVICSLYEPLDVAKEAIGGLTLTYAPEQAGGRAAI